MKRIYVLHTRSSRGALFREVPCQALCHHTGLWTAARELATPTVMLSSSGQVEDLLVGNLSRNGSWSLSQQAGLFRHTGRPHPDCLTGSGIVLLTQAERETCGPSWGVTSTTQTPAYKNGTGVWREGACSRTPRNACPLSWHPERSDSVCLLLGSRSTDSRACPLASCMPICRF